MTSGQGEQHQHRSSLDQLHIQHKCIVRGEMIGYFLLLPVSTLPAFPLVLKNSMGAATVTVYSANRIQLDKGRPIRKKKIKVGIVLTGGAHPSVFAEYVFFLTKFSFRGCFLFLLNKSIHFRWRKSYFVHMYPKQACKMLDFRMFFFYFYFLHSSLFFGHAHL